MSTSHTIETPSEMSNQDSEENEEYLKQNP
jgi:hypothetical protein